MSIFRIFDGWFMNRFSFLCGFDVGGDVRMGRVPASATGVLNPWVYRALLNALRHGGFVQYRIKSNS